MKSWARIQWIGGPKGKLGKNKQLDIEVTVVLLWTPGSLV